VNSGGQQWTVGTAIGMVLNGVYVEIGGGTAIGTVVNGGAGQELSYHTDKAISTSINSGALQVVYAGMTTGTIVESGGVEELFDGASYSTAIDTVVSSGGTLLEMYGGAKQSGTSIRSGGTLEIGRGTTLSDYKVSSGVTLDVAVGAVGGLTSGGKISNTSVLSGGTLDVGSGGAATGTTISGGALVDVLDQSTCGARQIKQCRALH
jgi:trimeric autotransporter adhesin